MPRRTKSETGNDTVAVAELATTSPMGSESSASADTGPVQQPAWIEGSPSPANETNPTSAEPEHGKNWGDPYKSIFNCPEQGFELGEHRRFKQRVFRFMEKPGEDIVSVLKEKGFTYRASEKAWTIPADADTRKMTDDLAREWAGPNYIKSVER